MTGSHTAALPLDATLPARLAAAYRDGKDSGVARQRRLNPWRADAQDRTVRLLSIMWARGYSAGNPVR